MTDRHGLLWRITITVLTLAASPVTAQTADIRLVPLARLGCADCAGAPLFPRVGSVTDLTDGSILAVAGEAPFIRPFGVRGELLAASANGGSAPGELRTPIAAAGLADGAIEVLDIRLLRRTRHSAQGGVVGREGLARDAFPLAAARAAGLAVWVLLTTDFTTRTPAVRRLRDESTVAELVRAPAPHFPRDREGRPTSAETLAVGGDAHGVRCLRNPPADSSARSPCTAAPMHTPTVTACSWPR